MVGLGSGQDLTDLFCQYACSALWLVIGGLVGWHAKSDYDFGLYIFPSTCLYSF
jgi:hypothetical protein